VPAASRSRSNFPSADERAELRERVGAFVRERREQVGLRPIDMSRAMGYRSANSIVNVESGIEGIPARRAYAWADLLELPRDAFFQFITGQIKDLDAASVRVIRGTASLTSDETELITTYRRLTPASRTLVRELAAKLAEAPQRRRR
jgi:hypothetical protein